MSTKIQKLDESNYLVNGKPVYEDSEGRFISKTFELTISEEKALHDYISKTKIAHYNQQNEI